MKFFGTKTLVLSVLLAVFVLVLPLISIAQPDESVFSNERGQYLIIVHDYYYDDILPLAEWKYKKGMEVEVAKLSVIGSTVSQIKSYITVAYNNWEVPPEYVLMVGNRSFTPTIDSDSYYADVEGDFHEELYIGRFSCGANSDPIETMVAKTVNYESAPYMEDTSWFTRACLIANGNWGEIDEDRYIVTKTHVENTIIDAGWDEEDVTFLRYDNPGHNSGDIYP
jgi:hypothetical protein